MECSIEFDESVGRHEIHGWSCVIVRFVSFYLIPV